MNGNTARLDELGRMLGAIHSAAVKSFLSGESSKIHQAQRVEEWTRLLSGEIDINPEIEALKTPDVRDFSAIVFLLEGLEAIRDDRRVQLSDRVKGVIDSLLHNFNQAAYARFDHLHEVMRDSMAPLLALAEHERQSGAGKKSKRGPSKTSGRELVDKVREVSRIRRGVGAWARAWEWLTEKAESAENDVGDFKIVSQVADQVVFKVKGKEGSLKKVSFASYWNSKKG